MTDEKVAEAMSAFRGRRRIPLGELLDPYGIDAKTRSRLVRQGLVREAEGKRAPHGAVLVDQDEAEEVVRAAVVATALGLTIIAVLRVIRAWAG